MRLYKRKMSEAHKILKDTDMGAYGEESAFHRHYTCFPRDDAKAYDCLKGMFDPVWSDTRYKMKEWKECKVPKLIPRFLEEEYLKKEIQKHKGGKEVKEVKIIRFPYLDSSATGR